MTPASLPRYPICHADGTVAATHVRTDLASGEKQMHWLGPDGSKGLKGVPCATLPLYGTETLRELDDDDLVVITEGEKDAASLQARGIAALGTVTGSSSCHVAPCFDPLKRFAMVAVWPDNDKVGHRHALATLAALAA